MEYEGIVIRPPSEAASIILQATIGCSHNQCTFCGAYRGVQFRIRSDEEIARDLAFAHQYCHQQTRLFLADGDALIIPQQRLIQLVLKIKQALPWVRRISAYASARSIRSKSDTDLLMLRELGVDRLYLGLESGNDQILGTINKNETAQSQEEACRRVITAGFFLCTTVILGLGGGIVDPLCNAKDTAALLNRVRPAQIAALSLMVLENTPLASAIESGTFAVADSRSILSELHELLRCISADRVQFMANHASNYVPLAGRLQRDKQQMLKLVEAALSGKLPLAHENNRAL